MLIRRGPAIYYAARLLDCWSRPAAQPDAIVLEAKQTTGEPCPVCSNEKVEARYCPPLKYCARLQYSFMLKRYLDGK